MEPSVRRVALLLFGSGFAALVYQTAWQRMFQLTFGASTAASAAVLAIFLGGLGLGGVLLGRRIERSTKPLLYYAHLEIGIALWTALTPFLRDIVHYLYLALGGSETLGTAGATAVRLVFAALVIGPAAVLMGGTLPAAARAAVTDEDAGRRGLALLYALNTVGAVFGALVGPLVLFGVLGTKVTLWAAVLVNLLVGLFARALARRASPVAVVDSAPPAAAEPSEPGERRTVVWAYFLAAAAGFGFLALELVWCRILSPILGGSSVTFGLILATALLGIGVGGLLFALRPKDKPATVELLALTLGVEALFVMVPFAWGDDIALLAAHLRHMVNLGHGYLFGGWVFIAAAVVFPTSVVSGYQFPALLSLLGRGRAGVGRQVGEAYAFNTVGTLGGSLLTGFVLLPLLGAVGTWRLVALGFSLLALAGAALAFLAAKNLPRVLPACLAACAALLLCLAPGPGSVLRHSPVGAGRVDLAALTANQVVALRRRTEDTNVWERDGVESSVAINVVNGIAFIVNGKSDGAVVADRGTQAFLGLLPAALHPGPKQAFVVGLGTGMTAGLLARAPGVERVDVAELEPSVVEVARRAALVNGNALGNPGLHVMIGDGRELLLTSRRRYDLIVSEPSNPYRAGVASLFTREFYRAAASRLAKGGLFAQWLQGYEIDGRTLSMALRTLGSVFPHVSIWGPGSGDLVLIGSEAPQIIDIERLRTVVARPHYLAWMRRAWGMEGVEGLLAHHIASPPVAAALAERVPSAINTDDVNLLEVAFTRHVGDDSYSALRDLFDALEPPARRPAVNGSIDWSLVDDRRHRIDWSGYTGPPPSPKTQATAAGCGGSMTRAEKLWPEGAEPSDVVETWVKGSLEAIRAEDAALARAAELEQSGFQTESLLIRSRLAEARRDPDGAVRLLLEAFGSLRKEALPLCDAASRALNRARSLATAHPPHALALLGAVTAAPFAVHQSEQHRHNVREIIGTRSPDPRVCARALAGRHGRTTWNLAPLAARVRCFEHTGSPELAEARAELAAYLDNEPERFGIAGLGRAAPEGQGSED